MSLKKYITESERAQAFMVEGDVFTVGVNEELAVEFDVVSHTDNSVVVEADDFGLKVLEHCGCQMIAEAELNEDDEQALMRQLMRKDGIDPDKVSDGGIFDKYRAMARKQLGLDEDRGAPSSECCDAPLMNYENGLGICSDCKEHAGAMPDELDEGMCSLKCKHCGDMLGQPTTDCAYDSMDPKGKNWIMVDLDMDGNADMAVAKEEVSDEEVDKFHNALDRLVHKHLGHSSDEEEEKMDEGKMSDIHVEIQDMVADGASNDEIKKAIPMASDSVIADIRGEMDESVVEADEASDMIAKMASMAGVGSTARSNHGIHEGEAGYQITPRSIVARQMRKLQDLANK